MVYAPTEAHTEPPSVTRRERFGVIAFGIMWLLVMSAFTLLQFGRFRLYYVDNAYNWVELRANLPVHYEGWARLHSNWDSGFFTAIALYGYEGTTVAFYPGYPLAVRTAGVLIQPFTPGMDDLARAEWAAVGVSAVCSVLAAWGMYEWVAAMGVKRDAGRAAFYLMIFPTAMFLPQIYTESLFLAAALWALALGARGKWGWAGLLAMLAALTRTTGVLLVLPLAEIAWKRRQRDGAIWGIIVACAMTVVGFLGWMIWLSAHGLSAMEAQKQFGRFLFNPNWFDWMRGQVEYMGLTSKAAVHIGLDFVLTGIALALSVWALRRWPGLGLFGLASMFIPLTTATMVSQNRYALTVLPVYLVLARWGRHAWFDRLWTFGSVLLFALYLILFTQGYWAG